MTCHLSKSLPWVELKRGFHHEIKPKPHINKCNAKIELSAINYFMCLIPLKESIKRAGVGNLSTMFSPIPVDCHSKFLTHQEEIDIGKVK